MLALGNGGDDQALRHLGGKILQAVYGEVDPSLEEGLLDFLREEPLGPDLRQRNIGDLVAGRLDDLDAGVLAKRFETPLNPACLPESELGTT